MRPTIFFAVILACGCGKKSPPALPDVSLASGPALPASIRLPESACGKSLDGPRPSNLFLNVNSAGEVIPQLNGTVDTDRLTSAAQIESYLKRHAVFNQRQTGRDRPEDVPFLRVDRDTPFDKVSPILHAFYEACYDGYLLRVSSAAGTAEGNLLLAVEWNPRGTNACGNEEQPKQFVIRAQANEAGQVTRLTFRERGSPDDDSETLGTDLRAIRAKLAHLAEVEAKRISAAAAKGWKVPQPAFVLEPDDRLPFGTVVQLLDAGLQAGITDIRLQSINPAP